MRKNLFAGIAIFTLTIMTATTAVVAAQRPMTRGDVLRHAFENSETLQNIESERDRLNKMVRETRGRAFPDINATFSYAHTNVANMPIGGAVFGPMMGDMGVPQADPAYILANILDGAFSGMGNMMNPPNILQWEVMATQVLFAQGKIRTGLRIADIALDMNMGQLRGAQFDLAQTIIDAYNGALLAQQNLRIQQEALSVAEESHRLSVSRFRAGRGNQLDTLNTKFAHQQAVFRLREAEMGERLALKSLANAANLPDANIHLMDSLFIPNFYMSEDEAWEIMQANSPTLRQLAQARNMQSEQTRMTRSDYLPTAGAFASVGQLQRFEDFGSFGDNDPMRTIRVGAQVNVPIWNGGQRRQRVYQARIEERQLERSEAEAMRGLRLALTAAFENLSVAKEGLAQVEQMLQLTEQGFRIAKVGFEVGQMTQLELNTNEQNFRMAQLAKNDAVFRINSAIINIARLIGDDSLITLRN